MNRSIGHGDFPVKCIGTPPSLSKSAKAGNDPDFGALHAMQAVLSEGWKLVFSTHDDHVDFHDDGNQKSANIRLFRAKDAK